MKCDNCALNPKLREKPKIPFCLWKFANAIPGGLSVNDCTIYTPINNSDKEIEHEKI